MKLQKTLQNEQMYAHLMHNMSSCYGLIGANDRRLNFLNQSQTIYKKLELNDRLGNSYADMANAYKSIENFPESIKYYDQAKAIFLSENMTSRLAQVLILQSESYMSVENYKKAEDNLNEAMNIAKDLGLGQKLVCHLKAKHLEKLEI